MSLQIEFVGSEKDEQSLVEFLLKRERLLAVPRLFRSNEFEPKPLSNEGAFEQIVFREADLELVRNSIRGVVGRDGFSMVSSSWGLTIEWTRTSCPAPAKYSRGRFYLDYDNPSSHDSTVVLNRLMTALVRYVKKTSPKESAERYSFYVGPDLARIVERGEGRVVYGNGKVVELVANSER